MGYLTTIMFRNDSQNVISNNRDKVVDIILESMRSYDPKEFGIMGDCNPIKSMGTSHADVPRVFVQYGNSLFEIAYNNKAYSKELRKKLVDIAENMLEIEKEN